MSSLIECKYPKFRKLKTGAVVPHPKAGKPNGRWRIQFVAPDGRPRAVRPPVAMARSKAETVQFHVDELLTAAVSGSSPNPATTAWLGTIWPKLRAKLVAVGLAEPLASATPADDGRMTVRRFIDDYITARDRDDSKPGSKAVWKPRTLIGARQDAESLIKFLGELRTLANVTAGDADDFFVWLRKQGYKDATIGKRIQRASQFFRAAVRKRLIADNPFADVERLSQENAEEFQFIDRETIDKVLGACPDAEWRAIVGLARFGGLRTPSETVELRWADVDFTTGRMTVRSPKTEHRKGKDKRAIPLFPELRPLLKEVFDPEEIFVFPRLRDAERNLRTQLLRIIGRAGVKPWPRLFNNLRASRQNELMKSHPLHVVCEWMGNDAMIAKKHYLHVLDSDFEAALKNSEMIRQACDDVYGLTR